MLNITKDQAERIAYSWLREQEVAIDCHGGYPGELYVVRDMLVSFINCNGQKYDGPSVKIMTVEQALADAEERLLDDSEENEFDSEDEDNDCGDIRFGDFRQYEAYGESVQSLAKYLMTAEGGPDEYSAGCPYKEDAPAVKYFVEKCKQESGK